MTLHFTCNKRELQCENTLISYKRAFKMLGNDKYITEIGQFVLEILSFEVGSPLLQKFPEIYGSMRLVSPKMT